MPTVSFLYSRQGPFASSICLSILIGSNPMWRVITQVAGEIDEMDKEKLLQNYIYKLPSESCYREHYINYARRFLAFAKDTNKATISRYIAKLRREMSQGSVNFAFRVVRSLFAANSLEWEFRYGEAPQVAERDEFHPGIEPAILHAMIDTAVNDGLPEDAACFLALSTTYGLRRGELRGITRDDMDLKNNAIVYVATMKHGRERYHLIPEQIKPYLERHDFGKRYSETQMSGLFWVIVNRMLARPELGYGVTHEHLVALKEERVGWHAIRRTLATLLEENGLDERSLVRFMRWKTVRQESAMPHRYHVSHFVGMGRSRVVQEAVDDLRIFEEFHPFIKWWS